MSKFPLIDINSHVTSTFDLFICSASFEDRCFSLATNLAVTTYGKSVVFFNEDQKGAIVDNAEELSKLLNNCDKVALHSEDPVLNISTLSTTLMGLIVKSEDAFKILIDITTFTHETLLMLFRLLIELENYIKVTVCYNDSKEYSYNVSNVADKWLTKGVGDVRNIIGYPGYISPARQNHLIILFGFEVERTQRVIEKFEADIVSIGFGSEENSISSGHFAINQNRHKQLLNFNSNLDVFTVSLIDPLTTKDDLLEQVQKYPGTNVIVAAMNTKLSTVGAALAFKENPDIQLCYVKANLYNIDGYSLAGENVYWFDVL